MAKKPMLSRSDTKYFERSEMKSCPCQRVWFQRREGPSFSCALLRFVSAGIGKTKEMTLMLPISAVSCFNVSVRCSESISRGLRCFSWTIFLNSANNGSSPSAKPISGSSKMGWSWKDVRRFAGLVRTKFLMAFSMKSFGSESKRLFVRLSTVKVVIGAVLPLVSWKFQTWEWWVGCSSQ